WVFCFNFQFWFSGNSCGSSRPIFSSNLRLSALICGECLAFSAPPRLRGGFFAFDVGDPLRYPLRYLLTLGRTCFSHGFLYCLRLGLRSFGDTLRLPACFCARTLFHRRRLVLKQPLRAFAHRSFAVALPLCGLLVPADLR